MPELDTSVFVIPRAYVKNGLDRYAVLNRIAKSVIDSCRGEHPEFVFTHAGQTITRINNSGWKAAHRRCLGTLRGRVREILSQRISLDLECTISSTPTDIDCEPQGLGSRIANFSWATNRVTSPRIIRRPKSMH